MLENLSEDQGIDNLIIKNIIDPAIKSCELLKFFI
jgi:hypothetical protein